MSVFDKVDNDLFFTCSLVERISRDTGFSVQQVTTYLGVKGLRQVHFDAPVLHCLVIEQAVWETRELYNIPEKAMTNCRALPEDLPYRVPSIWDIGNVYASLVTDVAGGRDLCEVAYEVMTSWIVDEISAFETATYWSSRDYIECCYREGRIL